MISYEYIVENLAGNNNVFVEWNLSYDGYYALFRNGYIFGGYYFPLYMKYGGSQFFSGNYLPPVANSRLPMLAVIEGDGNFFGVGFLFKGAVKQLEYFGSKTPSDPILLKLEPEHQFLEFEIYYDKNLCAEYNSEFSLNLACPEYPIIVKTIPFRFTGFSD